MRMIENDVVGLGMNEKWAIEKNYGLCVTWRII